MRIASLLLRSLSLVCLTSFFFNQAFSQCQRSYFTEEVVFDQTMAINTSYQEEVDIFDSTPPDGVIDITSDMSFRVCWSGSGIKAFCGNDRFDYRIAGVLFTVTNPNIAPFNCEIITIPRSNIQSDIDADGKITVRVRPIGADWNRPSGHICRGNGMRFSFAPLAFDPAYRFSYSVNPEITEPADQCQTGSDITWTGLPNDGLDDGDAISWSISPSSPAFTSAGNVATLDVSAAAPRSYAVTYVYEDPCGNRRGAIDNVVVLEAPNASLEDRFVPCVREGTPYSLLDMIAEDGSRNGRFLVDGIENTTGIITFPNVTTCYEITYEVEANPDCGVLNMTDVAQLVLAPTTPEFELDPDQVGFCNDGGFVQIELTRVSDGDDPILWVNDDTLTWDNGAMTMKTLMLEAPTEPDGFRYNICLNEDQVVPPSGFSCNGFSPSDTTCSNTFCIEVVVYNDGLECGINSPFTECIPFFGGNDPCAIITNASLEFGCSFLDLELFDIVEASFPEAPGVTFCSEDSICFTYKGSLPGELGDAIAGGGPMREIIGDVACDIIEFCIPDPFDPDECWIDPLPLGPFENICNQTLGQFISEALGAIVGGDGGGGIVVADRDGDGAFDQVVAEYDFPTIAEGCVSVNVAVQDNNIILRNIVGWPITPEYVCGDPVPDKINLLDLIPFGLIPVAGPIIEEFIATAGCNIDIVFTDEETIQIPVINDLPPVFANCNTSGYMFAEDNSCDVESNWSIPVAYDACYGNTLAYIGRTDDTDASFFNGSPPPVVTIDESGVYQIDGPIPGSELPPGTYSISYAAYSCYGVGDTCTFPVIVTSGDPVLVCPPNMVVNTDVDECEAVVTGLTPLSGIGCASIINYSIDYPAGTLPDVMTNTPYSLPNRGIVNDASGLVYPQGVTSITYTMFVDLNGDGDVSDPNETQTCTFTVTVEDDQTPDPVCLDIEVQLDNTGMIEIFAVDQLDGSPFVDGGSIDNCDDDPTIEIQRPGGAFGESVMFDCEDVGTQFINLRVTDADGNEAFCIAAVVIEDFFEDLKLELDLPEICIDATNPVQLDFSNYLNIILPNGQVLSHDQVASNTFLGDAMGAFGISVFSPHPGTGSVDPGTITPAGVYTPGTGTGYVTISYVIALPNAYAPPNGNIAFGHCFEIIHSTFELRQPLDMGDPFCECGDNEVRTVELGVVNGGLEPYTLRYVGATLDLDGDGIADDTDGEFVFDEAAGFDIDDFTQDLGVLRVEFTQPVWSLTVVDSRGCEIARAGSCDSDDLTEGPSIVCPMDVDSINTETFVCQSHYEWLHPLPTDNCKPIIYDYQITNPDGSIEGPFDLVNLLNISPGAPLDERFEAEYEFEKGTSIVMYYVEDAVGLFDTCSFTVTVFDDDAPIFQNCPRLPIVENAETGHCDAYVNFSAPYAIDNCADTIIYRQIDNTGLNSGDRFPVGTTILIFEAEDECGNIDTCEYKIIVNDFWENPIVTCPDSVYQINDLDECGAIVNDLTPEVLDSCAAGISVVYTITDENGDTIRVGTDDASGEFFPVGLNELTYCVTDQPLLMITEVTQQIMVGTLPDEKLIGGTDPKPSFIPADTIYGDYIEVTNFGPAAMDVSCLQLTVCVDTGVLCTYIVPNLTVIGVGEVLTLKIGEGMDDTTNLFFAAGCVEADINEPRGYVVSLYDRVIDVVATNGFDPVGCGDIAIVSSDDWSGSTDDHFCSGSYYREDVIDHNDQTDWIKATSCTPASIGFVNPDLQEYVNVWNGDTVGIQSVDPGKTVCTVPVLIEDVENPTCVEYDTIVYEPGTNLGIDIECGDCYESVISVPTDLLIGDINVLNLQGTAVDISDLDVILISPEGTEVRLFNGVCAMGDMDFDINFDDDGFAHSSAPCNPYGGGGIYSPEEELKKLYRENMMGDWTLQISNNSCDDEVAVLNSWELEIMGILPYSQGDTILPNDPTFCSAEFCWIHPILEDNCCAGTIDLEFIAIAPPTLRTPANRRIIGGTSICETFDVGRTLVKYTLIDQYGNVSMCSFEVEVDDVEDPVITNCPGDVIEHLSCGRCDFVYTYNYIATDNCEVDTIIVFPPNGSLLPIGDTTICVIARDTSGNADTCKYTLSVREFVPRTNDLSCVDDVNLSLDENCMAILNADQLLEGCNHRCYDNYILQVNEGCPQGPIPGALHSDTFTLVDVGKCFTVTVIDPVSGNSCWGCVCIEEKLKPEILCPPDDTITCIESLLPADRGFAMVLSCDPQAAINYTDSLVNFGDCAEFRAILYRKWTVTDVTGNKTRCTQVISIKGFDLDDVIFPRSYDNLDLDGLNCGDYKVDKNVNPHILDFPFCVDGYLLDSAIWRATGGDPTIMNPDARDLSGDREPRILGWNTLDQGPNPEWPSPFPVYFDAHPQWALFGVCWGPEEKVMWHGTGVPTLGGISLYQSNGLCPLSLKYDDEIYDICEDGYGVLRHWKVWDMCQPTVFGVNPKIHIQTIKVLDKQGPTIAYPDELTVGTDIWNCYSMWDVPAPWLTDECSSNLSYRVVVWDGRALQRADGSWYVEGLPLGVNRVLIEAYDGCGNTTQHYVNVTVIDDTPPVAICKDRLQLSLAGSQSPGTNFSAICAEDLDKASYDNCSPNVWFKMIRMEELLGTVNGSFADNTGTCGGVNGDDDAIIQGNQVYFDDCAKFCCEDAGEVRMVVLRVHDVNPGAGPVNPLRYQPPAGNLVGRFTDCWVEIDVVDKAQPIVVAPPDLVVSCMFWFDDSEDALSDISNETFGRVVTDLNNRRKVKTIDIVCEEWCEDHPKYDYEPSRNRPAIWQAACDLYNLYYDPSHPDDKYELVWGFDGYAINTCGVTPTIRVDDRRECGQGVINRDVIVTYQDPKTGGVVTFRDRQEIWVIDCDPFYATEDCFDDDDCINWPLFCQQPDPIDGCGADLDPYTNPNLGFPEIVNGCDDNCAMVAVDYEDEVFTVEPDACFKVIRTWTVIDWCTYDPLAPEVADGDNPDIISAGRYQFIQIIKVRDQIDPVITVDVGDCEPALKNPLDGICYGHIDLCAEATDDCSEDDWIVYDYKIDAFSDGVGRFGDFDFYAGKLTRKQFDDGTVLEKDSLRCVNYIQDSYCNPYADDPTQPFCASGSYPLGVHTIYWFAEDGCGNVVKWTEEFEILDCKEPTPYCKTGIVTVVMPVNGEICIWANDLNDGSFDNCTDTSDLKYYFNGDPNWTSYCVNCDSFTTQMANRIFRTEVEIWVEDEEGNRDFCVTTIEVQDNQDVCEDNGTIANITGQVSTYYGEPVQFVDLDLSMNSSMMMVDQTAKDGEYAFMGLDMYRDYDVVPTQDLDHLNGVTTRDLVMMQRHLLGMIEFESPYQYIAADVNNDEGVTASDISSLRKVILGYEPNFSKWDNTSWRFVPESYQFANEKSPWPFAEVLDFSDLDQHMYDSDFVGMKVGDVSGDVKANEATKIQTRSEGEIELYSNEMNEEDQQLFKLMVKEGVELSGYQFTLEYDPSELTISDVLPLDHGLNASHIGWSEVGEGVIRVSWHSTTGARSFKAGDAILALKLEDVTTSWDQYEDLINMTSQRLVAEGYGKDMEMLDLKWGEKEEEDVVQKYMLYQNVPNPFMNETVIGFEVPTKSKIVITFYDTHGRVVKVERIEAHKGYNQLMMKKTDFGAEGVIYYQLDAKDYTATKRMVVQ